MVELHSPERIVSLLDPEHAPPYTGPANATRHLRLTFHDVHTPSPTHIMPSAEHVAELIDFFSAWERTSPMLIHCRAGIGRSTAAAYIAACLHHPHTDELEIAIALRTVAPLSRPNMRLIKLGDRAMSRRGAMSRAMANTGRSLPPLDVHEGAPFELRLTY